MISRQERCRQVIHSGTVRTLSLIPVVLAALSAEATAVGFAFGGEVLVGPLWGPYGGVPPPAIIYDAFGRCLAPQNCPDFDQMRRFLDRYERNYGQRFAPDKPAPLAPVQPRDVPPTPEANIQPGYRGASQIRPEFEQAGKPVGPKPRGGE